LRGRSLGVGAQRVIDGARARAVRERGEQQWRHESADEDDEEKFVARAHPECGMRISDRGLETGIRKT
jgi:hypothetical protein